MDYRRDSNFEEIFEEIPSITVINIKERGGTPLSRRENNCPVTTAVSARESSSLFFIVREKTRAARAAAPLPDSSPPISITINPPPF